MKELTIKTPTSLRDIKLSQWQKFLRTTEGSEDDKYIQRQMVGIFCDIPDSVVNKIIYKDFNKIVNSISDVFNVDKETLPLVKTFNHKGDEYGFITNFDKITLGEHVDLSSYVEDWQNMDKAMGVLYRPIKHKVKDSYIINDYEDEVVSLDLTMDIVYGAYFFLQSLLKDLLSCIPNYIDQLVSQNPKIQSFLENGVGINQFTDSLEEIFLNLRVSLN